MSSEPDSTNDARFDYIIVGSGAGGGPLAARLALVGCKVLVIEAGPDHADQEPTAASREVSQVPGLHGVSTEHPELSWRFFVDHYRHPPSGRDPKAYPPAGSKLPRPPTGEIFYPRAAGLGGCTVHNAMITIAGPDSDWDDLADFLADPSWRSERMRPYFQRLERKEYGKRPTPVPTKWWGRFWENTRWLFGYEPDHTGGRHGFDGWLHTSVTDISIGLEDKQLVKVLKAALWQSWASGLDRAWTLVRRFLKGTVRDALDPNHAQTQAESPEGLVLIPLAVCGEATTIHHNDATPLVMRGRRSSPRELLLEVRKSHPENLTIWTDCLVTKVILTDGAPPRAIGVELLRGAKLYRAHPTPSSEPGETGRVFAEREVILCGGAFNTPQLLMLSGIGDKTELKELGIEPRLHLPGVGRNLQDRYEVTVISRMKRDFALLDGAAFRLPDPPSAADRHLREWRKRGTGLYTSNGAVLGIFKRSRPDKIQPDLFIFGVPVPFKGYSIGYSEVGDQHDFFTWTILKSHTRNADGIVRLRSIDPLDVPAINFHYFNEESRQGGFMEDPDLEALVEGVKFVRGIARYGAWQIETEDHPGLELAPADDDEAIKRWILRDAWGHHACGTCRMGPDGDSEAVLDSRFRVRGVQGLRVVDASIFPRIPGYFIVTNIYVASEKAADVILADFRETPALDPVYPSELREAEAQAIETRRRAASGVEDDVPPVQDASGGWSEDVTGLALSGGGIRSATFNLGVLQALARKRGLRRMDFLSTVSGGGYLGSFLGRWYDRLRGDPLAGSRAAPVNHPADHVERMLTDPDSSEIAWLRRHGNYIAPSGAGDARVNAATFVRGFLSVHFVVAALLLGVLGLANAVRYCLFDPATAGIGLAGFGPHDLPISQLVLSSATFRPFWSPWFSLAELCLLFLVLPRTVAYWLTSQDKHRRFSPPALIVVWVLVLALLALGIADGLEVQPLVLAFSFMLAFVSVELAWRHGRKREAAIGTGGVETQRLRARNELTYDLGLAIAVSVGFLAFAAIDSLGHALQQKVARNEVYAAAFVQLGALLTGLMPLVRWIAQLFARRGKGAGTHGSFLGIDQQILAAAMAIFLAAAPLVFYSFVSHASYQGGTAIGPGVLATGLAILITIVLAPHYALPFVNRSSLAQSYAAKLARAYLGATNPLRARPEGADITEVMPGDDVPSLRDYRPHESGGPLHLINVTVNQTVDFTSQRGNRDRKGENFAVSSLGMSVGRLWHGLWADPTGGTAPGARKRPLRVEPAGHAPGAEHPLVDETGKPTERAEMLSLRQWIGISGAAVAPGSGQTTRLGTALLFGLANLRTGYWWDSGITESARDGFPNLTVFRRFLYLLPRMFLTQALLLFEWVARFPGPWERFWYISDGGFFENLATYELIRRRVPRIIVCDAGADPSYRFEDFAELVRKARIDFAASIEPFTAADLAASVPDAALRAELGTLDELRPRLAADGTLASPAGKRAALFRVRYPGQARSSVLLYLKATIPAGAGIDVEEYQALHPAFPHESTGDQFFDEAQWESYRRLGETLATPLLEDPTWLWRIPL